MLAEVSLSLEPLKAVFLASFSLDSDKQSISMTDDLPTG